MTEVLLNSKCPNCGSAFDPDYIFGNLRMCRACKQWSVALANNTFNENVMFRIIHFEVDPEQIRKDLYDYFRDDCSLGFLRNIKNVSIEKLLIPVREIGSGNNRRLIPLNTLHSDIVTDLIYKNPNNNEYNLCTLKTPVYDSFIPRDKQKLFSAEDARSKDIKTEDIDIPKETIDAKYNILRDEYYRVIYLPIYRIHLGGVDKTWACYGLKDVYGLKSANSFFAVEKSKEAEKKENKLILGGVAGAIIGLFLGYQSCSATLNESGDDISTIWLTITGLFSLAFRTFIGWITGLLIGGITIKLRSELQKKTQLRRIFNE